MAAAVALSQPVTQKLVARDTPTREGQLALRQGLLGRRRALISAPITADTIHRLRAAGNRTRPSAVNQTLDQIREALVALNVVRYGRNAGADAQDLDRMLDNGGSALRRLRTTRLWAWRH